ncbi:class I adenylate-forming enzyme family protein [Janthinobacterium sp.]|uniref:class I adenylate-forming enzyme family protein n=1 Tax=Janthinobacterium sp. TaxID=1871054 RepID=UPI002584DE60|nr:class I adenylate-forming enzyme family protein [Janthinobacterium sp.]MCX7293667.1 class I adenylate-forming enzyme family protein [Janthinobacterium sp.]
MRDSLSGVLEESSQRYGDRILIELQEPIAWDGNDSVNWSARQILASSIALSAVWHRLGLQRGDRLAIYKANQFDIFLFSAAAIRLGAIAAPINGNVAAAIAARYMENIGASVLVTDQAGYARMFGDAGVVPPASIRRVVISDAPQAMAPVQANAPASLPALLALALPPPPPLVLGSEDPLYIVHTSGTTGAPKGVILESRGLIQSLRSALLFNFVSRRDVGYLALPLNHQVSQLYLHGVLLMGIRCILNTDFEPRQILQTLVARRPSLFFAFPITYTRLIASGAAALPLDSLRIWGTTADASHEVQQRTFIGKGRFFRQLGIPVRGALFVDGLGSSEVGIAALLRIVTPWTTRFERRVGRPMPFGPKVKIVDAAGVPVKRGVPGRLMIKGACMFAGYWNAHDTAYAATRDGWWFTGDMVAQDKHGEFVHLDREVDVMHTAHGAVYTLPMEEIVLKYPGVLDTCVFAIRDQQGVDQPAAVVALRDDAPRHAAQLLRGELNALLAAREQLHFLWVVPWSEFPIGATGKTLKRLLRQNYGAQVANDDEGTARACTKAA